MRTYRVLGVVSIILAVAAVFFFAEMIFAPRRMPRGDIAEGIGRGIVAGIFMVLGFISAGIGAILGQASHSEKTKTLAYFSMTLNLLIIGAALIFIVTKLYF